MTPMDAKWAEEFGVRAPIVQVPNGIDAGFFGQPCDREDFFARMPHLRNKTLVMFLGRIDAIKGLDMFLDAWAEASPAFPDAALVIVGPDPKGYRRQLEAQVARLGISSSVHFVGEWREADKRLILSAATLFIMPSYSENFGLAVAEAMATGVPVMASDRCGIVSCLQHGKDLWVVPCDRRAWSGALKTLLSDAPLRALLAKQGRSAAREHFDLRSIARRMLELYAGVLAQAARGKSVSPGSGKLTQLP
jgi:glycosyltransferase involved in cell wall biosynthesis